MPGAEPWSHTPDQPDPVGVLCLHGFTGNPNSMRPVARACAAAGFAVELPRLPGHGTALEEMAFTRWDDWTGEVDAAFGRLAGRCRAVVVAGQSMGGALALWAAQRHPETVGLVCINPPTEPLSAELRQMVQGMVDEGELTIPGGDSDLADPDAHDLAYDATPLVPLLSLQDGLATLGPGFPAMVMPLLLMTSRQDHVVDPSHSDHLANVYGGPVERIWLERSYHVATLDYDRDLVVEATVQFARRVTA
jgi:carboxylesterase